jgi:hypothetical protein
MLHVMCMVWPGNQRPESNAAAVCSRVLKRSRARQKAAWTSGESSHDDWAPSARLAAALHCCSQPLRCEDPALRLARVQWGWNPRSCAQGLLSCTGPWAGPPRGQRSLPWVRLRLHHVCVGGPCACSRRAPASGFRVLNGRFRVAAQLLYYRYVFF